MAGVDYEESTCWHSAYSWQWNPPRRANETEWETSKKANFRARICSFNAAITAPPLIQPCSAMVFLSFLVIWSLWFLLGGGGREMTKKKSIQQAHLALVPVKWNFNVCLFVCLSTKGKWWHRDQKNKEKKELHEEQRIYAANVTCGHEPWSYNEYRHRTLDCYGGNEPYDCAFYCWIRTITRLAIPAPCKA